MHKKSAVLVQRFFYAVLTLQDKLVPSNRISF